MSLRVRIDSPAQPFPLARGFYQQDENSLLLLVRYPGEQPRFFNHLESDTLRIETDLKGRLLALEYSIPREQWPVQSKQGFPVIDENANAVLIADLRFLEFRSPLPDLTCATNTERSVLALSFPIQQEGKHTDPSTIVQIGTDLYATVANGKLTSLLISRIETDRGGKAVDRWREELLPEPRPKN